MERKNYLGLGIILAIVTIAFSMMFLMFSYAIENEDEQATAQQNGTFKINFLAYPKESKCQFDADLSKGGGYAVFEGTSLDIKGDGIEEYTFKQNKTSLDVTYIDKDKTEYQVTISPKFPKGYEFEKFDPNSGTFKEPTKDVSCFLKKTGGDYSSVTISGKVQTKVKNDVLSGADVSLGNEKTGEVYATTHSDANGNYQMTGLDASLFKDETKLQDLIVMSSYPNKAIYSSGPGIPEVKDGIGYITYNISLSDADISILGAEFHKNFVVTQDVYTPEGKLEDKSSKWTIENVGFPTDLIPYGATFTIDENGVFNGRADQKSDGTVYALITCKPVGQDGHSFDYCEMSGNKYHKGNSFEFAVGATGITGVVHYTGGSTGDGQIAKTGDAIPYAVVVGLGLIAIVAFGIARKQYNK